MAATPAKMAPGPYTAAGVRGAVRSSVALVLLCVLPACTGDGSGEGVLHGKARAAVLEVASAVVSPAPGSRETRADDKRADEPREDSEPPVEPERDAGEGDGAVRDADLVEPDADELEEWGDDDEREEGDGLDNEEPENLDSVRAVSDEEAERGARDSGVWTPRDDRFFDTRDAPVRARMATMALAKVKRGHGGRSLGFKITLEDGTKGYFKAEQTFSAANWNSEVAAYHLDRMLGMHRVPPVVSRKIHWDQLRRAAGRDPRRKEIIKQRDGSVRGAFVWWIPGGLRTWPDLPGWEKWIRVRGWPSTTVTPLQRPAVWAHQLKLRRKHGDEWLSPRERHRRRNFDSRPDRADRAAELSDLIVFDYLTKNVDRWGGRNANVLVRGKGGALVFLDNGAGFAPGRARPSLVESRLHVLQRFRRSTVRAVKALDIAEFKKRLDTEPLAPILYTREFRHLKERREALIDWINRMEKRYGQRAFPWE